MPNNFNPLPPCGGRRHSSVTFSSLVNFNPLPPCGGRLRITRPPEMPADFNPLPPCGGRQFSKQLLFCADRFQSTPSVWRETTEKFFNMYQKGISIHSLRVEGDYQEMGTHRGRGHFNPLPPCGGRPQRYNLAVAAANISIHSLRVEGDRNGIILLWLLQIFQSTPSVWRETATV